MYKLSHEYKWPLQPKPEQSLKKPTVESHPEGDVKHGPALGEVDLLAAEHGVATSRNISALCLKKIGSQ